MISILSVWNVAEIQRDDSNELWIRRKEIFFTFKGREILREELEDSLLNQFIGPYWSNLLTPIELKVLMFF